MIRSMPVFGLSNSVMHCLTSIAEIAHPTGLDLLKLMCKVVIAHVLDHYSFGG